MPPRFTHKEEHFLTCKTHPRHQSHVPRLPQRLLHPPPPWPQPLIQKSLPGELGGSRMRQARTPSTITGNATQSKARPTVSYTPSQATPATRMPT